MGNVAAAVMLGLVVPMGREFNIVVLNYQSLYTGKDMSNKYYYVFLSPILRKVATALCGVLFICAFVNM